jgi:hypothetical protein
MQMRFFLCPVFRASCRRKSNKLQRLKGRIVQFRLSRLHSGFGQILVIRGNDLFHALVTRLGSEGLGKAFLNDLENDIG